MESSVIMILVGANDGLAQQLRTKLIGEGLIVSITTNGFAESHARPLSSKALEAIRDDVSDVGAIVLRIDEPIAGGQPTRLLTFHAMHIDPIRRHVRIEERELGLTRCEFNLLYVLASEPEHVLTRDQLVTRSKGHDYPVTDRSIDVNVAGLRKKLGHFGQCIQTVRGVGYRFQPPLDPSLESPETTWPT